MSRVISACGARSVPSMTVTCLTAIPPGCPPDPSQSGPGTFTVTVDLNCAPCLKPPPHTEPPSGTVTLSKLPILEVSSCAGAMAPQGHEMRSLRRCLLVLVSGSLLPLLSSMALADPPPPASPAPSATLSSPQADLTTPDVRQVLPAAELEAPLPDIDDPQEPPTVAVKGEYHPSILGGIPSLWWALCHPTQAWRIFTPIQ